MELTGRKAFTAVAALAASVLLAGCGQLGPGTAATVNGSRITIDQVRELADAQCAAALHETQGEGQAMPMAQVQQRSLGLLLETKLTEQYADAKGLHPDAQVVEAFWSQYRSAIADLPAGTAEVLKEAFHDFSVIRAILVQAGSQATGQQPTTENLQDLTQAGLQVRQPWLEQAEVHTDARYAPDKDGYPGAGDSSVSRPVSDFAKKAASAQPDPDWVSGLPAGQKCG